MEHATELVLSLPFQARFRFAPGFVVRRFQSGSVSGRVRIDPAVSLSHSVLCLILRHPRAMEAFHRWKLFESESRSVPLLSDHVDWRYSL